MSGAIDWNERLNNLAQEIISGNQSAISAASLLKLRAPELYEQICRSGKCQSLLNLWGECLNVDDNTSEEIVDPSILKLLGELTGVSMDSPVVHAGIQHSYGYLFSLIETPYGQKRERWTERSLETALEFSRPTFQPITRHGTLLLNLTYFLGRIMFRGRRSEIARLRRSRHIVDPHLTDVNYRQLKCYRIIEEIGTGKQRIQAISDLLTLANSPDPEALHAFLIYGIRSEWSDDFKLITAFPISAESFHLLLEPPCGVKVRVQLKYNAYSAGVTREPTQGKRTISIQ